MLLGIGSILFVLVIVAGIVVQNKRNEFVINVQDALTIMNEVKILINGNQNELIITQDDLMRLGTYKSTHTFKCGKYTLEVQEGDSKISIWDKIEEILLDAISYEDNLGPLSRHGNPVFQDYLNISSEYKVIPK